MKTFTPLLLAALFTPSLLMAQDVAPEGLVRMETERSRRCVPELARLSEVNDDLEPVARRLARLQAVMGAIAVEDSTALALDGSDPTEAAVRSWFVSDGDLARRWASSGDESLQTRRSEAKLQIRERVTEAMRALGEQGQARLAQAGDLSEVRRDCEDAILVRSVVLEACGASASAVCAAAREATPTGAYRFVDAAPDLWDVEELRPWSEPTRLGRTPEGGIGGARTGVLARRANIVVALNLEPLFRPRSAITENEAADFKANLDSLGFAFDDPRYVMAPAVAVRADLPGPLAGETHYVLHFGDLSNPAEQVIWTVEVSGEPFYQAVFPASEATLARLAAGEPLRFTAILVPEAEGAEGDAVFSLEITPVGQARSVTALLAYLANGQLARDLTALVPPEGGTGPGR